MEITKIELSNELKEILKAVNKGDLIGSFSQSSSIEFEMDRLKSVENSQHFAIGLRMFENGRVGNSYINSLNDKQLLLKNARESAKLGDEIDFDLPGATDYAQLPLYHQEVVNHTKEECIRLGTDIVQQLKSIDERAKIDLRVSTAYEDTILLNTAGFEGQYSETSYQVSVNMILVEDDGGLLYIGDSDFNNSLELEIDRILTTIEWRYRNGLKKASVKSGYMPVILAPDALSVLLSSIELAANGKSLYKGISRFSQKLNQPVASEIISIIDDPTYSSGSASYPFDDEGVIPRAMPIIEKGVFRNFIYDLATAKRMHTQTTGHASRSISSLPSPSFSNWIISPGEISFDQMIASLNYGLYVVDIIGGGQSNMINGDFSWNIDLGYLIEGGKIKGRIKDVMIAGNVFQVINEITAIENRLYRKGSLFAPHIMLKQVSVAG